MRFAISACFGLALLAGNTGCCLFCRPLFPCLHRHCGDCGDMGCERAPIFNHSRCCDPCDHCGDWTGQSIIARTGASEQSMMMASGRGRSRSAMASRVVPGSYREVATVDDSADEVVEEQVMEEQPRIVEAPAKRVRSSKSRPRHQVVRVQRVE